MPLSDEDKKRIEKEYEEEQYRKEVQRAAEAKQRAAEASTVQDDVLGCLVPLILVGIALGALYLVIALLRWLEWTGPAAT